MPCELCGLRGEVLIGPGGKIVWRLEEAIARMPCPAGCIGGALSCCDGACGGPREITNEGGSNGATIRQFGAKSTAPGGVPTKPT